MADRLRLIWVGLVDLWCGWTHGGGQILRDPSGCVNWQCNKCGRWAQPVSKRDEANLLKRHIDGVLGTDDQTFSPQDADGR